VLTGSLEKRGTCLLIRFRAPAPALLQHFRRLMPQQGRVKKHSGLGEKGQGMAEGQSGDAGGQPDVLSVRVRQHTGEGRVRNDRRLPVKRRGGKRTQIKKIALQPRGTRRLTSTEDFSIGKPQRGHRLSRRGHEGINSKGGGRPRWTGERKAA